LRKIIPSIILAALIVSMAAMIAPAYAQGANYSWIAKVSKVIWFAVPEQNVPYEIPSKIDVYLFGLRPSLAATLASNPAVKLYSAPSGIVDLLLNPAPVIILSYKGKLTKDQAASLLHVPPIDIEYITYNAKTGVTTVQLCAKPATIPSSFKVVRQAPININPLCFRQIRFAFNYIVDRNLIVRTVYKGYAIPMYAPYSVADPTYQIFADIVAQYMFTYDPQYANKIITKVLTEVGAKKINGMWYYQGKPITLKFIIRTEDERREIGLMVSAVLKQLGFNVQELLLTFGPAITKVYSSDPMNFEWSIYTEGWGKGPLDRWDPWTLAWFAAPWLGDMPGWLQSGWWQYQNATLDKLTMATCLGKVKSKAQWIAYMREALKLALDQSVRIWIVTTETIYPANAKLAGVTLDLGMGLRDIVLNLRNWYVPGRDYLRIGHLHVWTARTIWNIYGGFFDVYSVDPEMATYDPWMWSNPFNGEPMPFRVTYHVVTAGPTGKLKVPSNAVVWVPSKGWVPISQLPPSERKKHEYATSAVYFYLNKFIGTHYHDGETITWADVLGDWALWFDIAYNKTKAAMEPSIASSVQPLLQPIVAILPVPKNDTLIVYINYWFFDKNYIAENAIISSVVNPFPLAFAQQFLCFDLKKYALSSARARAKALPQLNLVLHKDALDVMKALEMMKSLYKWASKFTNVPGIYTMPKSLWEEKIEKEIAWIKKYGIAWISDGPFMLTFFSKDEQKLILQRFDDPKYPLRNTDFYFGIPTLTKITGVSVPTISPGGSAVITVDVTGEFPITIIYMILEPTTHKLLIKGNITTTSPTVLIRLTPQQTAKLAPFSSYDLILIAFSSKVAMATEKIVGITTGMSVSTLKSITSKVSNVSKAISSVKKAISAVKKTVSNVTKAISSVKATVSKVTSAVAALQKTVSSLSSSLKAVNASISSIKASIAAVKQSLAKALASQIASVRKALGAQVASAIKGLTSTLTTSLSALETSMSKLSTTLTTALKSMSSTLSTVSSTVSTLSSTLGTVLTTVKSTNAAVSALNTKVSALSSKVSSMSSELKSISTTLSGISTELTSIKQSIASLKSEIASMKGAKALAGPVYAVLGIVIANIIITIVTSALLLRRRS